MISVLTAITVLSTPCLGMKGLPPVWATTRAQATAVSNVPITRYHDTAPSHLRRELQHAETTNPGFSKFVNEFADEKFRQGWELRGVQAHGRKLLPEFFVHMQKYHPYQPPMQAVDFGLFQWLMEARFRTG